MASRFTVKYVNSKASAMQVNNGSVQSRVHSQSLHMAVCNQGLYTLQASEYHRGMCWLAAAIASICSSYYMKQLLKGNVDYENLRARIESIANFEDQVQFLQYNYKAAPQIFTHNPQQILDGEVITHCAYYLDELLMFLGVKVASDYYVTMQEFKDNLFEFLKYEEYPDVVLIHASPETAEWFMEKIKIENNCIYVLDSIIYGSRNKIPVGGIEKPLAHAIAGITCVQGDSKNVKRVYYNSWGLSADGKVCNLFENYTNKNSRPFRPACNWCEDQSDFYLHNSECLISQDEPAPENTLIYNPRTSQKCFVFIKQKSLNNQILEPDEISNVKMWFRLYLDAYLTDKMFKSSVKVCDPEKKRNLFNTLKSKLFKPKVKPTKPVPQHITSLTAAVSQLPEINILSVTKKPDTSAVYEVKFTSSHIIEELKDKLLSDMESFTYVITDFDYEEMKQCIAGTSNPGSGKICMNPAFPHVRNNQACANALPNNDGGSKYPSKIYYKGYWYKVRKEGRFHFITTKDGKVPYHKAIKSHKKYLARHTKT